MRATIHKPRMTKTRKTATAFTAIAAMVLALLTSLGLQSASASPFCNPYPDVDSTNIHCDNIDWLKGVGITKPADGNYHPESSVTRGSMAAFLFRLTHPGKASPTCTSEPFPDVATDGTFCGYIQWAKANKITFGYPDGTYGPENAVTRGAMAAYLYRIDNSGHGAQACTTQPFKDVTVDETFCGVITWMKGTGITVGVGGGKYGTTLPVTRQSMATFLHRMVDRPNDIGETFTWLDEGAMVAQVTVEGIKRVNSALSVYRGPPEHTYIVIDIKAEAYSGIRNSILGYYPANPFNWSIKDHDGYNYDAILVSGIDHELDSEDLYPGEKTRGKVVVDAPKHGTIVLDAPGFAKAKWKY